MPCLRAWETLAAARMPQTPNISETAFFRHPDGGWWLGHGPFSSAAAPPADGSAAFYINDFSLSDRSPWKIPARLERVADLNLTDAPPPQIAWQTPSGDPFAAVFQEIMEAIRRGAFEKTVPGVVEAGAILSGDPLAITRQLATLPPNMTGYGWIRGNSGFVGATPELLFSLAAGRLQTMALAGTARREEREVFAIDEKEIREHEYVAQTLLAKLADIGMVRRSDRRILDLGPIVHFLTPIDVELYSTQTHSIDALIRRLHPTPALGPLPRTAETMALLLAWRQRLGCPAFFGAPFGFLADNSFRAVVAIRALAWNANHVQLPAGCGIIEASRLVNEWRELRLKREAVKSLLSI